MNDQLTTQLLLALVATQAPAPPDDWLRSQIPPFGPRPTPPDPAAWRALRFVRDLGSVSDFDEVRRNRPGVADETEAYELRLKMWQGQLDEHNRRHGEAARFRWRVEWAGRLLAAVHDWERKVQSEAPETCACGSGLAHKECCLRGHPR